MIAVLVLSLCQSYLDLFPQHLKLNYFLKSAQLVSLYLLECEEALGSPSWQPNHTDFCLAEAISQPILLNAYLPLLLVWIVIRIDDEVVFSYNIFLFHVVLEDILQIDMESHKFAQ